MAISVDYERYAELKSSFRYALVVNDLNEVAGRTGLGTVMASKNLKAIAVRGKQKLPVADPAPLQQTAKWVSSTMEENHYNFHHYGTGAGIVGKHLAGHKLRVVRQEIDRRPIQVRGMADPPSLQGLFRGNELQDARVFLRPLRHRRDDQARRNHVEPDSRGGVIGGR